MAVSGFRQNVIKLTPALKSNYTGWQTDKERNGGGREAFLGGREGSVYPTIYI